jgi:spore germination protein GerM
MSHEKKMRDLMARLVSMSPEPPPYPEEETPMARHQTKRNRRPMLVFAGAAALVALLALPLLLFSGGSDPVAVPSSTTTTTMTESSTTAPATTTTITPDSTTTSIGDRAVGSVSGVVFLTQTPENSFLGNPALVPIDLEVIARDLFETDSNILDALAAIDARGGTLPEGLESSIPPGVRVVGQAISDGVIVADMNQVFLEGAGGLLADTTMLNQLVYTLTHGRSEDEVLFTVDGEPVEAFGTEGIFLADAVGRDTFIDQLANIFLTDPISELEHVYAITGIANTFEGNLAVRVLDGGGNSVHEEFTQATCGSGCWGEFGVGVDSGLIVPGASSIQVFTYSAEDGSMIDVVTVPIPEQGYWSIDVDG